jgi:hypothetical protein
MGVLPQKDPFRPEKHLFLTGQPPRLKDRMLTDVPIRPAGIIECAARRFCEDTRKTVAITGAIEDTVCVIPTRRQHPRAGNFFALHR